MATTTQPQIVAQSVRIPVKNVMLDGDLNLPDTPRSIVLFAHGSGSGRHSSRNRYVAGELNAHHHATLLMDLLTREEEDVDQYTAQYRFDIGMLADRLVYAIDWLNAEQRTHGLPIGLFGASTGAAAALIAAAQRVAQIKAVVSRGGRPDLAGEALPLVQAPTLLIVGGDDDVVIELNNQAMRELRCEQRMEIIPGATHLFEERGALEQVADLARRWFDRYLLPT